MFSGQDIIGEINCAQLSVKTPVVGQLTQVLLHPKQQTHTETLEIYHCTKIKEQHKSRKSILKKRHITEILTYNKSNKSVFNPVNIANY